MAYYLAAGVCGLGYFAYVKRKQLLYRGLLFYNRYIEKKQLNDDKITIQHMFIEDDKILNMKGSESNDKKKL